MNGVPSVSVKVAKPVYAKLKAISAASSAPIAAIIAVLVDEAAPPAQWKLTPPNGKGKK